MEKEEILGVDFRKTSLNNLVLELKDCIENNKKIHLHTVNVDHLILAQNNMDFNNVMQKADIIVADGMPIVWYSKIIKKPLPERVTGVDLSYSLCEKSAKYNFKMFFLGAKPEVSLNAQKNIEEKYPDVNIVGRYSPSREEMDNEDLSKEIVNMINESGANVLLVALGAPRQEMWISKYMPYLKTNINIGVGATLDFMAGSVKRAPVYLQKLGLEWFYRLCSEPKRMFKRYIINDSYFIILIIKDLLFFRIRKKH